MSTEAVTPYPEPGGQTFTSGHSGTDTSRERAEREDSNGTTGKRQAMVLGYAEVFTDIGITVKDLRDITDLHHGQASAALSNLHMSGHLARLAEKRDRCHVYVLPEWVKGRETQPHARNLPKPEMLTTEEQALMRGVRASLDSGSLIVRSAFVKDLLTIIERLTNG